MCYCFIRRFNVTFILIMACPFIGWAEFAWTSNCLKAYEASNRLEFANAARYLKAERTSKPGNLIPLMIEGRIDFLHIFALEETGSLEAMKEANKERITALERDRSGSAYQRLSIAELYLFQGIGRLKSAEYFGAVYDIRRAYRLLEENKRLHPSFIPNLKGLGFLHTLIGAIPENFRWVTGILGLEGSIAGGLGELSALHQASMTNPQVAYLREECVLLLTVLGVNLGKETNYPSLKNRLHLIPGITRRPLLCYALAGLYFHAGENDSVITLLNRHRIESGQYRLPHLHYLLGNALLHRQDSGAGAAYAAYLSQFRGKSYTLATSQRMAWLRLLKNDLAGYRQEMGILTGIAPARALTDEDKAALEEARSGRVPNVPLLKARLYFDGGYYSKALHEIAGKPVSAFPDLRDRVELTYRLARIFEKQGKLPKAIEYYSLTLKNGEKQTWYFAANSALLIGQIHEESGAPELARHYYRKALELRNHEYQNSIDQKAKAGLNRLEQKGG